MELYQIAKQTSILNVHKKHKDWKSLYKEEEERERQRRLKQEMQQGSGTLESVAIESGAMGSSETSAMEGGAMESSAGRSSIEEDNLHKRKQLRQGSRIFWFCCLVFYKRK